MQKYFAGELRPDQEKSWRAEDGIFVLTSKAALEIAARDKKIDLLITDKELDRQEIFTLSAELECYKLNPDEKTKLISKWQKRSFDFEDENHSLREEITTLKAENEQLRFGRDPLLCPRADK